MTVPADILLSKRALESCGFALYVRKDKHIPVGSEGGQILYDYCMENGIKKLASPSILYTFDPISTYSIHTQIMSPEAHAWIVRYAYERFRLNRLSNEIQTNALLACRKWLMGDKSNSHMAWLGHCAHPLPLGKEYPDYRHTTGSHAGAVRFARTNTCAGQAIRAILQPVSFVQQMPPRTRMGFRLLAALGPLHLPDPSEGM